VSFFEGTRDAGIVVVVVAILFRVSVGIALVLHYL
jgi:hypothetical protein